MTKSNQTNKTIRKKKSYSLDGIPSSKMKMQYYKQKRNEKRLKNTIFQMHYMLKIIMIFLILWGCSRLMICHYWYLPQGSFDSYPNEHINIISNKITPDKKILEALRTEGIPNKPIYLINTSNYEKEIEKLSPVKKAFVRRYWFPARFEVTIEEEIPVITISPNPKAPEIAAMTLNGVVIPKEYLPIDAKQYKTYKILTYDEFKNWSPQEVKSLQILAKRIEDFSGEKLLYLDIRNQKDAFAMLETIKIRIGELNSTLKDRIERLSSVMPQIENLKSETEYVDIRWDNTTYLKKKAKEIVEDEYITADAPITKSISGKSYKNNSYKKTYKKQNLKKNQKPTPKKKIIKKSEIINIPIPAKPKESEKLPDIDIEVVNP